MNLNEICPNVEICPIYKNWTEQTGDKRLDVIYTNPSSATKHYSCLAKSALEDVQADEGVDVNDEIKQRLKDLSAPCSYISLLNLAKCVFRANIGRIC